MSVGPDGPSKPRLTPKNAAEIQRLLRRQRVWIWVVVIGVGMTLWGWICSPLCRAPAAVGHHSSDVSGASSRPETGRAVQSAFDLAAPIDMGDDTFSPLLVQRRFADVCPDIQVVFLPRETTTTIHVGSFLPVALCGKIYAPGPVAGWRTMIAYITMTRDDEGKGTILEANWSCGLRLRSGGDSSALDGLSLPYDVKELFSADEYSRHRMSLRDVVRLWPRVRY